MDVHAQSELLTTSVMSMEKVLSMVVLHLVICSLCWLSTANGELRLVQQSPLGLPCPGSEVVYQCTLSDTAVIWSFPGSEITLIPSSNEVVSGNFRAQPVGVVGGNFTSTLTFTAESRTVITCISGDRSMNASQSVTIQGPPSLPSLSCVDLSEDVSGSVSVTVSWTLSADFYFITITTNDPQPPHGGLLNITNASVTQRELTGFQAGYEYAITVHGINCQSQEGSESEPLTITPQVPDTPASCISTLSYNQSSQMLLSIDSTWDTVADPVDPGRSCPGPSENVTEYQINIQTGSLVFSESVNASMCIAGQCIYTFEPASNLLNGGLPSGYGSVSVVAENVVGMGIARTCTAQHISTINNFITGEMVDISSPNRVTLRCTFLSGFTGSAHCQVQYGTDPTYMNLPFSSESNETGTAGESVSVVLREQLNSSTVYYYTVLAPVGDVTVTVLGTFTTPKYNCPLSDLQGSVSLPDASNYPRCQQNQDTVTTIIIPNGEIFVTCYSGRQFVSVASYVCSDGYQPNVSSSVRVCRDNGAWSGSTIACDQSTLSTGCVVGIAVRIAIAVTGMITLVIGILTGALVYHCISKHRSRSSSSHKQQQGPEYEEVPVTIRRDKIELKDNIAYGPVPH